MEKEEFEKRKRSLRANMIRNEMPKPEPENKEEKEAKETSRITRIRSLRIAGVVVVILVLCVLGYKFYVNHYRFKTYEVISSKDINDGNFVGYEEFGDKVLKYGGAGVECLSKEGDSLWSCPYSMSTPYVSISGDYVAIADRGGYAISICDKSGNQGSVTTTLPISKVAISSTGITVAILEDTASNYIMFYDKSGNKLQIEVQTTLSGNGYPMDIDISPNGMLLVVSYVYLDEGKMENQVVFYNFDEEGQSIRDRLIAGFKEYETNMVARVAFLDDIHAVAFAQDRVCLYSLENTIKPALLSKIELEQDIRSIFYSSTSFGYVTEAADGAKTMYVYDASGKRISKTDIDMEYETVTLSNGYILFYKEAECAIYNQNGNLKYQNGLEGSIKGLLYLGNKKLLQISSQQIMQIGLK